MEDAVTVDAAMNVVNEGLHSLAGAPGVDEIQTELANDGSGDAAAFITVIVKDNASGEPYPWTRLKPIYDLIWRVFTELAVPRKPLIDFRLRSEIGQTDEDESLTGLGG